MTDDAETARDLRADVESYELSSVRPRSRSKAIQRVPFATFVNPRRRSTEIARLRSVASTCGALPVRTWERSSS